MNYLKHLANNSQFRSQIQVSTCLDVLPSSATY